MRDFTGVSSCRLVPNLEGMPLAILTEKMMFRSDRSSFFSCQNDRHTLYALQGPLQQEIQPAEFGLLGPDSWIRKKNHGFTVHLYHVPLIKMEKWPCISNISPCYILTLLTKHGFSMFFHFAIDMTWRFYSYV